MVRGSPVEKNMRAAIVASHKDGKSVRVIARETHLSPSTVQYIIQHHMSTGTDTPKRKTGRPKVTTTRDDNSLRKIVRRNRRSTTVEVNAEWSRRTQTVVSTSTCRRRLHELGMDFYKVSDNQNTATVRVCSTL